MQELIETMHRATEWRHLVSTTQGGMSHTATESESWLLAVSVSMVEMSNKNNNGGCQAYIYSMRENTAATTNVSFLELILMLRLDPDQHFAAT